MHRTVRRSPFSIAMLFVALLALRPGPASAQAIPIEKAAAPVTSAGANFTVRSGSYYLSRNITMKGGSRNAINITGPNVSIDFRGYGIIGKNSAGGIGINAPNQPNITIQNGNIIGMGGGAILVGNGSTVRSMHIAGGGPGIVCGASCVIEDNVVTGVSGDGIDAAGLVEHNVCDSNTGGGIKTNATANTFSTILGNEVSGNTGTGIAMQANDGFIDNVINGAATTSGGVDGGNNVCNGLKTCP